MEGKCLKKSTAQQLQALVEYMGENPEFASGSTKFGPTKMTLEEQWKSLTLKLNSMGPPSRSVVEWKKTWADMKSRTKKKISENKKSLQETGGGLYREHCLTDVEAIIDKTLFLSKSANPSGSVHGFKNNSKKSEGDLSIENCFQILVDTPPRGPKNVAVITPTRGMQTQQQTCHPSNSSDPIFQPHFSQQQQQFSPNQSLTLQQTYTNQQQHLDVPHIQQQQYIRQPHTLEIPYINQKQQNSYIHQPITNTTNHQQQQQDQHQIPTTPEQAHTSQRTHSLKRHNDEIGHTSSTKKRKIVNEQISLIRHQIRVSEDAARSAKNQSSATHALAEAVNRMADAAKIQAEAAMKTAEAAAAQTQILTEMLSILKNNSHK